MQGCADADDDRGESGRAGPGAGGAGRDSRQGRRAASRRRRAGAGMKHTVAAELVGNVAQVAVVAGDEVDPATTLVILESMKMEIPVVAEGDTIAVIDIHT